MLKCPFCSHDYSDHGLRDGRCPSCGSVLAWEGGSGDVPDDVRQKIFAQTMQSIRPGMRFGPVAAPIAPPPSAPPSSPAPENPSPTATSAANVVKGDASSVPQVGEFSSITPPSLDDLTAGRRPSSNRPALPSLPQVPGRKTESALEKVIGKTTPVPADLAVGAGAADGASPSNAASVDAGSSDVGRGTVPVIRKTVPVTAPLPIATPRMELGDGREADDSEAGLQEKPPEISSEVLRTITPASLSPQEADELSEVWKEAAGADDARPQQTLKGSSGRGGKKISDTQLVIQTRSVVNKQDRQSIPIEAEYELLNVIGKGGVGVVYLARQSSIDRDVAIKMLRGDRVDDPANRDKFLAEAVVTGDLDHPNIVPIYDLGNDPSGALFYSMKRVQGTPWNDVIREKSLEENLEILLKVSDAIAFAHARGIVHRDIKSENVMLGDFGEVLVMDWGIALPLETYGKSSAFLRSQGLGGSPAYMSPEMVTGPITKICPASDVYLLGATLFEIITGRPPHLGRDVMECLMAAARNVIVSTDKSGELLEIALRAMATRVEDRYATVQAFQMAIRDYKSHAESILLSTRAADELTHAKENGEYESYSRAVFGFQEALNLWDGNRAAATGLNEAKLAYARGAFEKGDFDLGLSLLDSKRRDHQALYDELTAAITERDARQARLRYVRRLVIALVALLFIGGTASFIVIVRSMNEAREAEKVAKQQKVYAEGQKKIADEKTEEEKKQRENAETQRKAAETSERKALASAEETRKQKLIAEDRRLEAEDARQEVEESSYFTEINVVAAKIRANSFDVARQILSEQAGDPQAKVVSRKARYRNWEWARLRFLSGDDRPLVRVGEGGSSVGGGSHSYRASWPIEAFALDAKDRFLVLGSRNGDIELRTLSNESLATTKHVGDLASLALSPDGMLLASGSGKSGLIQFWSLSNDGKPQAIKLAKPVRHGVEVRALAFAPNDSKTLYSVADNVLRRWEAANPEATEWRESRAYHGHLDRLTCVAVSNDGKWVLTGSEDSTVRLWNAAEGRETARFRGHEGPVYAVALSPDGGWMASAGFDKRILLWDFPKDVSGQASGDLIVDEVEERLQGKTKAVAYFALTGHSASVRTLAFSAMQNVLLSGGQDNTAIVWNAAEAIKAARAAWKSADQVGSPAKDGAENKQEMADPPGAVDQPSSPLVKVLRGHGTWIRSSAISRDGKTVLTHSNDGSWRRWDVAEYDEVLVIHDSDYHPVTVARYVGDGKRLLTAHSDGGVRLWESATGKELGRFLEGHEFLTTRGAYFPDGKKAITTAGDGTTRIWDTERFVELHCLYGTGRRGAAVVAADGNHVLTAGPRGVARWWNATTGVLEREFLLPSAADGKGKDSDSTKSVRAVDEPIVEKAAEVTAVALSPSGEQAFTGSAQGRCWLWNVADGRPTSLPAAHNESVSGAYFVPATEWSRQQKVFAVSVGLDGRVVYWKNDAAVQAESVFDANGAIDASVLSTDGRHLIFAATLDERRTGLWWWDMAERKTLAKIELNGESVNSFEFRKAVRDQAIVSVTDLKSSRQYLRTWSLGTQSGELRVPDWNSTIVRLNRIWQATESPDGKKLLAVGGSFGRVWDPASGTLLGSLRGHSSITAMDVSNDGRWLVTAGSEGALKLWNVDTQESVWRRDVEEFRRVSSVRFSPDGKWLLLATGDALELWEAASGQRRSMSDNSARSLTPPNPGIDFTSACFAPDGRHVVSIASGSPPALWQLVEGATPGSWTARELHKLTVAGAKKSDAADADRTTSRCVAFSTDGQWIATGGDDRIARLWSARDGRLMASLEGHSATVTSVAFSADGLRLVTGADDARVTLWDIRGLSRWQSDNGELQKGDKDSTGEAETREIFTLSRFVASSSDIDEDDIEDKTHGQGVTTVAFSPNGSHVLTASNDGTALIWPGVRLEPAIDLSLGKQAIIAGGGPTRVDERALVSRQSGEMSSDFVLFVSVKSMDDTHAEYVDLCELTLLPTSMLVGGWKVENGVIGYQSPLDGQTQNVGAVAGGARGEPLVIRLQRGAPGHLLESIVRNIAASYPQWPVAKPGDATEAPRLFVVEFRLAGTEDAAKLTQPETRFVEFSLPGRGQSAHRPLREKAERGQR